MIRYSHAMPVTKPVAPMSPWTSGLVSVETSVSMGVIQELAAALKRVAELELEIAELRRGDK
jgi:hypothetical protein